MLFRFIAAFLIFTFGPGAACGLWLTRSLDTPRRIVVLLGIGTAAAAVFIDILGRLGWLRAFPYIAVALTLAALAAWRRGHRPASDAWSSRDLTACTVIVMLAVVTGYVVFYGTAPGQYGTSIDAGNQTSLQLALPDTTTPYFFAVCAYNAAGSLSLAKMVAALFS